MLRKQANAGLLLLVFVLASPLAVALCDAACAGSSAPGTHHASATAATSDPAKIADDHHAQHSLAAAQAPVADLLGNSSRCVSPRLDVVAASKSSATTADLCALSNPFGIELAPAIPKAVTGPQSSAPDTSPPASTPLRI